MTDSFIRRPWMIVLLPFRLIALSYSFVKKRGDSTESSERPTLQMRSNPKRLLLMATTEEGLASIERCASIARGWLDRGGNREAIILSTSDAVSGIAPEGCSVYTLPDPKSELGISTSNWNQICANMLVTLMDSHRPAAFILDGPFPYSGILKAMSMRPWIDAHWIRSHPVTDDGLKKRASSFKSIVKLSTHIVGDGIVAGIASPSTLATNLSPDVTRIFYALGYDKRQGNPVWEQKVNEIIRGTEGIELVTDNPDAVGDLDPIPINKWKTMACSTELNTIDLAIVGSEPHLIQQLLFHRIPTLSIVGSSSERHRLVDLRRRSFQSGLFVLDSPDTVELKLALNSLFKKNTRRSMRIRSLTPNSWDELFEHISAEQPSHSISG